jgi:PPIC-type PPIASE domain
LPRVEPSIGYLCVLLACGRVPAEPPRELDAPASTPRLQLDRRVVAQLEQALGVTPERARELASEDALLAAELARREPGLAQSLERTVLARALARVLLEEAERSGPPTDSEVEQLTRARWWELDRPRMVQVVHAVVLSDAENLQAEALAQRIARAVEKATDAAGFKSAARAVPAEGHTVKVETLPPVTGDGRALDPEKPPPVGPSEQHFAAEFAVAAQRLERVGQLSPVVRTPFGYHVLFALRVVGPRQPTLAERSGLLGPQVLQRRALAAQAQLLERQRKESPPEQSRAALRSMAKLAVTP